MNLLVLDVETTIHNKGNPFDTTNKLCQLGLYDGNTYDTLDIEYSDSPYKDKLIYTQEKVDSCDLLIGFNLKFDLHWIRNYGINFSNKRVWDVQLVHFILTNQSKPFPSLNDVCEYYGLDSKLDVVAEEYWNKGIDTPNIPWEILAEYLEKDLLLTMQCYEKQLEEFNSLPKARQRLITLHNLDLLVLEEMEYNGLLYDEEESLKNAKLLEEEIQQIQQQLSNLHSIDSFNYSSGDHLSCLLYGGTIVIPRKELVGVYKTGERKGQDKYGWVDYSYELPRLVTPIKGSELKKEGYYSTDEQTLKSLKCNKKTREIIDNILKLSVLEKRRGTYYEGIPKLISESCWEHGKLHGQFNQCVVRTGRLSASRPNTQNMDSEIKGLFGSRYA